MFPTIWNGFIGAFQESHARRIASLSELADPFSLTGCPPPCSCANACKLKHKAPMRHDHSQPIRLFMNGPEGRIESASVSTPITRLLRSCTEHLAVPMLCYLLPPRRRSTHM